jgi:hypothetical protein
MDAQLAMPNAWDEEQDANTNDDTDAADDTKGGDASKSAGLKKKHDDVLGKETLIVIGGKDKKVVELVMQKRCAPQELSACV